MPTGVQDYRPALYGGIARSSSASTAFSRVALDVDPRELERRIVLAYTGAPRNSGTNNWEITKRHIDGDRARLRLLRAHPRHRRGDARGARARRLGRGRPRRSPTEWENRKRLAPGVTTPAIDDLIARATAAGRHGGEGLRRRRRRLPVLLRPARPRERRSPRRWRPAARALLDFRIETRRSAGWITRRSRASSARSPTCSRSRARTRSRSARTATAPTSSRNHPHELARARRSRRCARFPASARTSRRGSARSPRPATAAYHHELLAEFPPTMLDLLRLQGVGPEDRRDALPRARHPDARRPRARGARRPHPRASRAWARRRKR